MPLYLSSVYPATSTSRTLRPDPSLPSAGTVSPPPLEVTHVGPFNPLAPPPPPPLPGGLRILSHPPTQPTHPPTTHRGTGRENTPPQPMPTYWDDTLAMAEEEEGMGPAPSSSSSSSSPSSSSSSSVSLIDWMFGIRPNQRLSSVPSIPAHLDSTDETTESPTRSGCWPFSASSSSSSKGKKKKGGGKKKKKKKKKAAAAAGTTPTTDSPSPPPSSSKTRKVTHIALTPSSSRSTITTSSNPLSLQLPSSHTSSYAAATVTQQQTQEKKEEGLGCFDPHGTSTSAGNLPTHPPTHPPSHQLTHLATYLPTYPPIYLPTHPPTYPTYTDRIVLSSATLRKSQYVGDRLLDKRDGK